MRVSFLQGDTIPTDHMVEVAGGNFAALASIAEVLLEGKLEVRVRFVGLGDESSVTRRYAGVRACGGVRNGMC